MDRQELLAEPLAQATPAGFTLDEVVVRLARADERVNRACRPEQRPEGGIVLTNSPRRVGWPCVRSV